MKYLNYMERELEFRTEIIDDIKRLVPDDGHGVLCYENIGFGWFPRGLVEQLLQWGVTTSDGRGHNYEGIEIDILIHILRSLELHPPQK